MNYNALPYEELLPLARELAHGRLLSHIPARGIEKFVITSTTPVVAKERPRNSSFHTPKKTRDYEEATKEHARKAMWRAGYEQPFRFPVEVRLEIRQVPPKSWSDDKVKLARAGYVFITQRDLDNMEKAVMDAFNGVVFFDDRQVVCKRTVNLVRTAPGFTASFRPIGLTKNEAEWTEKLAKQIRKGVLN